MDKNYSKIKYGLVVFGILCLTYNLWEFFTAKYSTKQGVTFVIECLLGIGLIFLPDLVNKFLKIIMPPTIVYFYWFFLFISVFLGTSLHMISRSTPMFPRGYFYYLGLHLQGFVASSGNSGNLSAIH